MSHRKLFLSFLRNIRQREWFRLERQPWPLERICPRANGDRQVQPGDNLKKLKRDFYFFRQYFYINYLRKNRNKAEKMFQEFSEQERPELSKIL
jgi:hypothetical protein